MALPMVQSIPWAVSGAQAHASLILLLPEPVLLVLMASPVISSLGFKCFLDPLSAATCIFNTSYPQLRGRVFLS